MDSSDFTDFVNDQERAKEELKQHQWASARVPIKLNEKHPIPRFRNKVFWPLMTLSRARKDDTSVFFVEVRYVVGI
jgi:hypothetical protein